MPANNSHLERSVTQWLESLKADRSLAGQRLWERYVEKLARLARRKLGSANRREADEEDIVIEVFTDFLEGLKRGRFSRLADRQDLWQILTMLTERKVIDQRRRQRAAKRGEGKVQGESVLWNVAGSRAHPGIGEIAGLQPTPQFAAEVADNLRTLLEGLPNDLLRELARDSLAGYTQEEMAKRHHLSLPTIQRKLRLIRTQWQPEQSQ